MSETEKPAGGGQPTKERKPYDLEERTFEFARRVRALVRTLPRTVCNIEDGKQLVRASGAVGSNYIEANESLGSKDFVMHLRISRKEAEESRFWLRLLYADAGSAADGESNVLVQEAVELMRIFGSMVRKKEHGG